MLVIPRSLEFYPLAGTHILVPVHLDPDPVDGAAGRHLSPIRSFPAISPTFRTSLTRYRAKGAVSFSERELLHLAHQALELLVVAEPLPA